jgi:hypothetical protein
MSNRNIWTTEFDHVNDKIINDFPSGRFRVAVIRQEDTVIVFKDGAPIKKNYRATMQEYLKILEEVADADTKLMEFGGEEDTPDNIRAINDKILECIKEGRLV